MASLEHTTTFPSLQRITPDTPSQAPLHATTLFLAGPTDVPWREEFTPLLEKVLRDNPVTRAISGITIFDPFQPAWDSTWKEDYDADPRFRAQTDWELDHQEAATLVVVYFDERAKCPVTLVEFGLCARSGRAVVGCQAGFWKRGSVQAVCARLGVPLEDTLEGLAKRVVTVLKG